MEFNAKLVTSLAMSPEIYVGVPHIKGLMKKVRASSYTKINAVLDIIDNIPPEAEGRIFLEKNGDTILNIRIIDNDPYGFTNILERGEKNPFNLAHSNSDRHSNDNFQSEFGCGLKEAGMYLANTLLIYTSIVKDEERYYYKIEFNFVKMESCPCPIASYTPDIQLVHHDEYLKYNLYGVGSSINLLGIRQDTDSLDESELKDCIIHTYAKQLHYKNLYFNNEKLERKINIYDSPICEERKITTELLIKLDNKK